MLSSTDAEWATVGIGHEPGDSFTEPTLARAILGTADAAEVYNMLEAFCSARLGSAVEDVLLFELSVGAAFGVRLADGRRVLVKSYPPNRPPEFLHAVHRIQSHLSRSGFPCPAPVAAHAPFGSGFATAEEFVDAGEYADAHDPAVRRESAGTLAWLVRLAGEVGDTDGIGRGWSRPPRGELWPQPHNVLYDFPGTAPGSSWIEGIAAGAKSTLDSNCDGLVVGHADWSSKHLQFEGLKPSVVYDWDSLRLDVEPAIAGGAAVTFPANRHLSVPKLPTPEEAWLFIQDYESVRGRPFTRRERTVAASAAIYTLAYLARCEHAQAYFPADS
ncbi:hypothetical protein BH24ACT22_BH24ACT22_01840 [soil metagenome]